MDNYSVLLVDDDPKLLDLLANYFNKEQFTVLTARDGEEALRIFRKEQPQLLVLDLMLPKIDGRDVCRTIRQDSTVPIIMLTARDAEFDRLMGLELGADDYVTKPFSMRELVARVRALLRRTYGAYGQQKEVAPETVIRAGTLELDLDRHILRRQEEGGSWKPIELTPIEFSLLEVLMKSPGHVYNRLQLMENSHGFAFDGYERTIDAHIRNLRRKIEPDTKNPQYILTVYGIGYKFGG
ncbi:response regulator transcription factor [Acidaminococcus fermentans]|uniref:response regulator transcription factor n=1 Tax=Acidaminococcus fermentans TaxID=905 RepID=UPI00242EC6D1|nr:response regulator transcription factor [Acidaminococcus fermentans]